MIKNLIPCTPKNPDALLAMLTSEAVLEEMHENRVPEDLGPQQSEAYGWAYALPGSDDLVASFHDLHFIRLGKLQRKLPAAAVKREVDKRVAEYEQRMGDAPNRQETREIKESVRFAMLPDAPIVESSISAYYDKKANVFGVMASSEKDAELMLEAIRMLADSIQEELGGNRPELRRWVPSVDPLKVLTSSVREDVAPAGWVIGNNCKLEAGDGKKANFSETDDLSDNVKDHILNGMVATELGFEVPGESAFKLDKNLRLKGLKFGDVVQERIEVAGDEADSSASALMGTLTIEAEALRNVFGETKALMGVEA